MTQLLYKKEFCKQLTEHMAKGYSYESFGPKVGVHRYTLYSWEKRFPEWKEAKKLGQDMALSAFETMLIGRATGHEKMKDGETTPIIFALKTRFHQIYGEKQKHEHAFGDNSNLTVTFVEKNNSEEKE